MNVGELLPDFVGLSSVLTGYDANAIAPKVDPLDDNTVAMQYLRLMLAKADNEIFLQTLAVFREIVSDLPDPWNWTNAKDPLFVPNIPADVTAQVEAQILSDAEMSAMSRRMIRLWYLATWYASEPPDAAGEVVSMDAYKQGLAWPTFQAHPMGYSELVFGYWADPPPTAGTTPPAPPIRSAASATPPAVESGGSQRGGV
jgi:hypothetical protein